MLNAALLEQANWPPPEDLDIRPGTIREVLKQYEQQWPFRDEQTMRTVMAYLVSNTKDVYGRIADRFPRDMYLDSLLVKEKHISAVNSAKLVGDYTLLKQLTAAGMFYEQIVIERRHRPLREIDLSGLPFTLSSFLYSRAASPTAPVELKPSARKDYERYFPSGWIPQKNARKTLIALGVDAELVKALTEEQTAIFERGGLPNFGRPLTGNRTAGQFFKETAEEIAAFYGDFYSNGGMSPVGRAFGTFLGDVLATPFRALEAKEFLTDPEYRHYVNPGGTSLKDYLGAVFNLGLELGVIKLEILLVKAVGSALKPALKNLGEKIAEALKRDGMEPIVADNYAKRFDEAIQNSSDAKLNQAVQELSSSPSASPGIASRHIVRIAPGLLGEQTNLKGYADAARSFIAKVRGKYVVKSTGYEVEITGSSIKKGTSRASREKALVVPHLPELLENSIPIKTLSPRYDARNINVLRITILGANAEMGGRVFNVQMMIKEMKDGRRLYDWGGTEIKELPNGISSTPGR